MNFRQKDGFGVEVTAYESHMMKDVALTSFTLYAILRLTHNKCHTPSERTNGQTPGASSPHIRDCRWP